MNRRSFIKKSALLSAGIAASPWSFFKDEGITSFSHGEKKIVESGEIPVLVLEGTPRQRGQIHGESLREKITEIVAIWKEEFSKVHEMHPDKYIDEFIAYQKFDRAIRKWTPELEEEVKGIAEGAGIDEKTMYAFQLPDEEWWYSAHKRIGVPLPEAKNCSALGVFGQKELPTFVAQNMDIMTYTDGYEVLFRIKHQDSGLESLVFSFAGIIALCGMNNHSLGICCNTLLQLDHRPDGLPVAFVVRGVLAQKEYDDAVKFVNSAVHASGQNYTIGGPKEAAAFECSAHKVSRFIPYEGAARVYHTNHPLVNDDQEIFRTMMEKLPQDKRPVSPGNSEIRLESLKKRLKDPGRRIDIDAVKDTLSSHDDPKNPVCRHIPEGGGGGFTAGCVIYELGDPPRLHLAPGPPCSTEFKVYEF